MILIYPALNNSQSTEKRKQQIFSTLLRHFPFSRMQYLCFYCCCKFISLFSFWTVNYVLCTVEAQRTHGYQCSSNGEYLKLCLRYLISFYLPFIVIFGTLFDVLIQILYQYQFEYQITENSNHGINKLWFIFFILNVES